MKSGDSRATCVNRRGLGFADWANVHKVAVTNSDRRPPLLSDSYNKRRKQMFAAEASLTPQSWSIRPPRPKTSCAGAHVCKHVF
jgi:hypothetical protein